MDWTNTTHLLQGLYVLALGFAFMKGYDSGNKL